MFLKAIKTLVQLGSLITMSLLFLALWQNPDIGFSSVAGLALGSLFLTQYTIQQAWRLRERGSNAAKAARTTALIALALTFSITGVLAGAEYSNLDKFTGVKVSRISQGPVAVAFQATVTDRFVYRAESSLP